MPNTVTRANIRDELDRSMPAAFKAKLGTTIYALIDLCNKQNAVIKALVTKLNADTGVADTDYTAASLVDVKKPEQR